MQAAPPALDTTRCPLCGEANRCAVKIERETGVAQGPCWCFAATFTDALRERLPSETRGLACICARCALAATETAAAAPASPREEPTP